MEKKKEMSVKGKQVEEHLISLAYRLKVLFGDIENLQPVLNCLADDTNARLSVTKRRQCEHELRVFFTGALILCNNMMEILQEARTGQKYDAEFNIELEA